MQFSRRATRLAESATMRVSRRALELAAQGREVCDLSAGEPDFPSPACALEAAHQALAEGFTRYTAASGIPDLKDALAERYQRQEGAPWSRPDVLVTVGAKAALYELFQVLVDDGDEVVLPYPAWVSFAEQVHLAGGRPVAVPTADGRGGFVLEAAPILDAVSGRTKAILVNSPSNPTGATIAAPELRALVEGAAERGLVVVSDETYERFVYDGQGHASAAGLAREYPETVVLVGSFSKSYAMTGWRVGFCLGPRDVIAKAAALQSHLTSNPTSFAMRGAVAALAGAEDDVVRMLAEYARRRAFVVERLAAMPGVSCAPPAGAFYAFPRLDASLRPGGSLALAERLLEEAGVAVVPGQAFGADEHLRISYACSSATLEAGMERLAAFLA